MSAVLNISLVILVFVIIAAIIATTIYLVKFLMELALLTKNLNETTDIVKKELDPILVEVKDTLHTINVLATDANSQISTIKKIVSTVVGFGSMFAGKFKFLSGNFMKGFLAAFNLFRKK